MYTAQSLKISLTEIIIFLFLLVPHASVRALSTDKDQDIEILADSAELDDKKGTTIYRGNVIVTQGSIKMTGDKMTVHFDENDDIELVTLVGNPATYKQLPDNSEVYDEAEALRMEYYELKSLVVLIDKALVTQEGFSFSGKRIEYDTLNSRVKAKSQLKPGDKTGAGDESKERVRIIIKPKKKK